MVSKVDQCEDEWEWMISGYFNFMSGAGSLRTVSPPQMTCIGPAKVPPAVMHGETVNCRFSSKPYIKIEDSVLIPVKNYLTQPQIY
jgi:hypothetical protein